jgi:hypothetical protein
MGEERVENRRSNRSSAFIVFVRQYRIRLSGSP